MDLMPLSIVATIFAAYTARAAFRFWMYEPKRPETHSDYNESDLNNV